MDTQRTSFIEIKRVKIYSFIITLLCHIVLILLLLFQAIWVFGGSETTIIYQATLQTARVNILVKDAEIIAYRTNDNHVATLSEMQVILKSFEQTRNGLINGDPSLGLPSSINREDIHQALSSEQLNFLEMDIIFHTILQTGKATNDQVSTLLSDSSSYIMESNNVTLAWKTRIDNAFFWIFIIEAILTLLVGFLVLFKHRFVTSRIIKAIEKEQHE